MKFLLQFFILVIVIQPSVAGQSVNHPNKIDSLLHQLRKSRADSNRVSLLNEISVVYLYESQLTKIEFSSVINYLHQAINLNDSLHLGFDRWKYKSLYLLGNTLCLSGNTVEGKKIFEDLIKVNHAAGDIKKEAFSWFKYAKAIRLIDINDTSAYSALSTSISIYKSLNDTKSEIEMSIELAYLHFQSNDADNAEQQYLNLLKKSEASGFYKLSDIYFFLSVLNRYKGNFNIALSYALRAEKSIAISGNTRGTHNIYGELGEVYELLKMHPESIEWYKKCLAERERLGAGGIIIYGTYGLLVKQLILAGRQHEALGIIKNLEKRNPPQNLEERAGMAQSFASCYDAEESYGIAEKYYLESLDLYIKSGLGGEIIAYSLYDILSFYVKRQQFKKAVPYFNKLITFEGARSVIIKPNMELMQFKIDSANGRYISAIKHFQEYKSLNDSVFNEVKSKQIEELKIQYETEKKDKDLVVQGKNIEVLTKQSQLQLANLRQEKNTRKMILASLLMLIILLGLLYNRYMFKQRNNRTLELQQKEINEKNISLQHLVNEKDWLVKEIHHRVKNNFHIVMSLLGTQSGYLKNEEAKSAILESQQRVHAMSLIHQKLYQSEDLSAINMPAYVHELVEYLKDSSDVKHKIRFDLQIERIDLDVSYSIPIGLILNEAITNAIKYAFPVKEDGIIKITLNHTGEDTLLLSVADNGVGVPEGFDLATHSSMGMNLMKGLSKDIGGIFSMKRKDGTQININFTYDPDLLTNILSKNSG